MIWFGRPSYHSGISYAATIKIRAVAVKTHGENKAIVFGKYQWWFVQILNVPHVYVPVVRGSHQEFSIGTKLQCRYSGSRTIEADKLGFSVARQNPHRAIQMSGGQITFSRTVGQSSQWDCLRSYSLPTSEMKS